MISIMKLSNIKCKIEPLETKQYVTRAIRPPFSVLNKSKIKNEFGISIPHWMDGLRRCIGTLHEGQNILMVAHGNTIRALMKYLEDITEAKMAEVEMPFDDILVYHFLPGVQKPHHKSVRTIETDKTVA